MSDSINATIHTWHAPELLPVDSAECVPFGWHSLYVPTIKQDTVITAATTVGKSVEDVYGLLEHIYNEGIGYPDAIVGYALPLFIALLAFSFGFLFDAVNHLNEKYDSPSLVKMFEEHSSRRCFFLSTRVCVWIAGIYALASLILSGCNFWIFAAEIINPIIVCCTTAYALITIRFAHFCMEFNKPTGVIRMLEEKRLLPPDGVLQKLKRIYAHLQHRNDEDWAVMQEKGKQFYAPFIELQERNDYINNIVELSKHLLQHKDSKTFEQILTSVKRMSEKYDSSFNDYETISVIDTLSPHYVVGDFMSGIMKLLGQYPQSPDFCNDLCRWYLSFFNKNKMISRTDIVTLQQVLIRAVNNRDIIFLKKYVQRSSSYFYYLDSLHKKSYVLGECSETTDRLRVEAHKSLELLRNAHYFVMAYASYIGLHDLLRCLTKTDRIEGLYPSNRKEVLSRYARCLKTLHGVSVFASSTIEDLTGRTFDIGELFSQYTSILLMLVNDKSTIVPISSGDIEVIEEHKKNLEWSSTIVKSNSQLCSLYPVIKEANFGVILKDAIASAKLPKTFVPKMHEETWNDPTHSKQNGFFETLMSAFDFVCDFFNPIEKKNESNNNYTADVNLNNLYGFEYMFRFNHSLIQKEIDKQIWGSNDESKTQSLIIDAYKMRLPKIHFIYDCYSKNMGRYYQDCINTIEERITYAYLTALGNMQITNEYIFSYEKDEIIKQKIKGTTDEFVLLKIGETGFIDNDSEIKTFCIASNLSLCDGLPLYEFFKDRLILINKDSLPYLDGWDSQIAHSHEESDEEKGLMDIVTKVDCGLKVKYSKDSHIVVFNIKPTELV